MLKNNQYNKHITDTIKSQELNNVETINSINNDDKVEEIDDIDQMKHVLDTISNPYDYLIHVISTSTSKYTKDFILEWIANENTLEPHQIQCLYNLVELNSKEK